MGCKQTKYPFFRKYAPENAPKPPVSIIGPALTLAQNNHYYHHFYHDR